MEHLKYFFDVFDESLNGHISKVAALKIIGLAATAEGEYTQTVVKVCGSKGQK